MDFGNLINFFKMTDIGKLNEIVKTILAMVIWIGFISSISSCFFGYKLFKIYIAVIGFIIFGVIGFIVSALNNLGDMNIFIALLFGIIGAFLAYRLYLIGVFIMYSVIGLIISIVIFKEIGFAVVFSMVIGILSVKFAKPVIIISTGISGGFAIGNSLSFLMVNSNYTMTIILSLTFALAGIWVQFHMDKINKNKADEISSPLTKQSAQEPMQAEMSLVITETEEKIIEDNKSDLTGN